MLLLALLGVSGEALLCALPCARPAPAADAARAYCHAPADEGDGAAVAATADACAGSHDRLIPAAERLSGRSLSVAPPLHRVTNFAARATRTEGLPAGGRHPAASPPPLTAPLRI